MATAAAVLALLCAGCGGASGSSSTDSSAGVSPRQVKAREHLAEMCAEARLEGEHLQGCRDFYKLRAEGE